MERLSKRNNKAKPVIVANDLLDFKELPGVHFIKGSFAPLANTPYEFVGDKIKNYFAEKKCPIDVIMSDMAPNATGSKDTDHYQQLFLCEHVLDFSRQALNKNGYLVVKVYTGSEEPVFAKAMKEMFQGFKRVKPAASRKESREIYFVGLRRI